MNTAFLYIKPHAATDKVKALVERELKSSGLSIVSEGTMQTNDIKVNPRIVHFNVEVMRPDSQIFYYVVQWSETNMSWNTVRSLIGETSAQGIRGKIRSTWRELLLEEEPRGVNDSLYFSDSALSGLADRMEWLGARIEDDPTGSAINSAGRELLDEARFWVRNVSVGGKPALVLCRGFNTSELIAALRRHQAVSRPPLKLSGIYSPEISVPPDSNVTFDDRAFKATVELAVLWTPIREVLRSNPISIVPEQPSMKHISPCAHTVPFVLSAMGNLALHSRDNIDRLFVTKNVRRDGRYVIRLFRDAEWHAVTVDDNIPVEGQEVLFVTSYRRQWWPLLLYKALAKFVGSYKNVEKLSYEQVMHAMSGKPVMHEYVHPRVVEGSSIPPGSYCGDPKTSNYWRKLGNHVLRGAAIVRLITNDTAKQYGLPAHVPIDIVDAHENVVENLPKTELRSVILKLYRPEHKYSGPYGPGSRELSSEAIQETFNYDMKDKGLYFLAPSDIVAAITDYLTIVLMAVDDPIVVSNPWETKMGLPGSTLFRRGAAVNVTNKGSKESKLTVVVKETRGGEATVGLCSVGPREGPELRTALLTGNLFAIRSTSDLVPQEAALPLRLGAEEAITLVPVCDPVHDGYYAMLFYGVNGSAQNIGLTRVPSEVDVDHPIDYEGRLTVGEDGQTPIPLFSFTAQKETPIHVLMKQLRGTPQERRAFVSDTYISLAVFADPKDPPIATLDKVWGLTEVALITKVAPGSYVVAGQCTKSSSLRVRETFPVRCSVFSQASAGVIVSDYRDREAESLADARLRERLLRKSIDATNSRMNQHVTSIQITEAAEVQGGAVAIDD